LVRSITFGAILNALRSLRMQIPLQIPLQMNVRQY